MRVTYGVEHEAAIRIEAYLAFVSMGLTLGYFQGIHVNVEQHWPDLKNKRVTYHFGRRIDTKSVRVQGQNHQAQGTAIEGRPNRDNHGIGRSAMVSLPTESWADGWCASVDAAKGELGSLNTG
jgi:hypothetical protein